MPRGSRLEKYAIFGVRERKFYRLKGRPMRSVESSRVAENREKVSLKVEYLRGSHPSSSGGKEKPSKYFKKDSRYEMAMEDAQKKETSRIMFKGSESSEIGQTIMEGINFVS
jgi:hypothetical protein